MGKPPAALGWIGRVLARVPWLRRRESHPLWIALAGILVALSVTALRIDILRMRYGLGEALETEQALVEEKRRLTAQVRRLRNPTRLTQLAIERGLRRPERVIDLRSDSRWTGKP